ncbi:unnamed protein product, partial [Symbiodinium necroappetens]
MRTSAAANSIYEHGMQYLRSHVLLCKLSMRMEKLHWHVRPKVHAFAHQLRDCKRRRFNIRHHHTFREEDAMRWLK